MKNSDENEELGLFPDIEEYLATTDHGSPISLSEANWLIDRVVAKTSASRTQVEIIIRLFLQELRTSILNGEKVRLTNFGTFFVASPTTTGTSRKIFISFKPSPNLIRKLNE